MRPVIVISAIIGVIMAAPQPLPVGEALCDDQKRVPESPPEPLVLAKDSLTPKFNRHKLQEAGFQDSLIDKLEKSHHDTFDTKHFAYTCKDVGLKENRILHAKCKTGLRKTPDIINHIDLNKCVNWHQSHQGANGWNLVPSNHGEFSSACDYCILDVGRNAGADLHCDCNTPTGRVREVIELSMNRQASSMFVGWDRLADKLKDHFIGNVNGWLVCGNQIGTSPTRDRISRFHGHVWGNGTQYLG